MDEDERVVHLAKLHPCIWGLLGQGINRSSKLVPALRIYTSYAFLPLTEAWSPGVHQD
jgi:hypothetical protein